MSDCVDEIPDYVKNNEALFKEYIFKFMHTPDLENITDKI